MNVLEPILDSHFHPDSYACRKGKGTHAAATRLQSLMRRHRHTLQCDVRKFFPSIDHALLKESFRRLIKDRQVLTLLDRIVDSSNEQEPVQEWFRGDDLWTPLQRRHGLPIGNLTSQWFGLTFVGYRLWPTHRVLRRENVRRFRRRVRWMQKAYAKGQLKWEDIRPRLASWLGHAGQADSKRLVERLSQAWVFSRAKTASWQSG
jgi:hypothetical protein